MPKQYAFGRGLEEGWREARAGTLGPSDNSDAWFYTTYTAATQEYEKMTFFERSDG